MSIATRTPYATVEGHVIGRTKSAGWSQFYVTTPEGRIGLVDDADMPVESCDQVTPENLPDVIASIWHWDD